MTEFIELFKSMGQLGTGVLSILAFCFVLFRWGIPSILAVLGAKQAANKLRGSGMMKKLNGENPGPAKTDCPFLVDGYAPLKKTDVLEAATQAVTNGIAALLVTNPRLSSHYESTDRIAPAIDGLNATMKEVSKRLADFDNILSNEVQGQRTDREIGANRLQELRASLRGIDSSLAVLADRGRRT